MSCRNLINVVALALPLSILAASALHAGEMKYPNWNSQWRNLTAGQRGNPWDITKPMGLKQEAPLTPEYQALFEASLANQKSGGQGNSEGASCILPGMPKVMSFSQPMQIFIRPHMTWFIPQNYPTRHIFTDGRTMPADQPPEFGGYSIGKWLDEDNDGVYDVLEVETRNFKGPRVYESTGLPLHADNQTIVKERIYVDKNDPDTMYNDITTIDNALTRPWTVKKKYVRDKETVWVELNCYASNNHIKIGSERYFSSASGELMPTRKDQPPPDLVNFK